MAVSGIEAPVGARLEGEKESAVPVSSPRAEHLYSQLDFAGQFLSVDTD